MKYPAIDAEYHFYDGDTHICVNNQILDYFLKYIKKNQKVHENL